MKIRVANDRMVFPSSIKIANKYESDTRTIDFDLSKVEFHGNTYLVLKYRDSSEYFTPLLIGESMSIPVKTFMSAKEGTYDALIVISTVEISEGYDFSQDNPMFISNVFQVIVEDNFLSGTEQDWALTPAAQNYFDQLIALVEKVQSDLDSGAFVGNGIQSITKISTSGLVDTYQITFTNGSTFDYQVTNGQNGQTPTITIQNGYWYINGVNTGQQAQGEQGEPGKDGTDGTDGVGIQSIEKTFTEGNVDTYTITYTNETTSTFTVTNGINGFTPNITIGTVATLQPTEQATATITGTLENPVLNLGIPQGVQGEPGQGGNDNKLIGTVEKTENPSVSDSYNTELMDLKFYGKSTQKSTTGANIFNPSNNQKGFYTTNGVGSPVTLNVSTGWSWEFELPSDLTGQYTFSLTTTVNVRWRYYIVGSDDLTLFVYADSSANATYNENTFEIPEGATKVYFSILEITGADQAQIMLNAGSSALPYEIYTGGQPSPSPAYPQDITAIEEISGSIVGKNLIDDELFFNVDNWTNKKQYPMQLKPNTQYTFSRKDNSGYQSGYFLNIINSDGTTNVQIINSNTQTYTVQNVTFTTKNDGLIYFNTNSPVYLQDILTLLGYAQLEVGSTPTSYEPYTEQPFSFTPLKPLYSSPDGTIYDVVNVETGDDEYNMSGIVVFNGSVNEIWSKNSYAQSLGKNVFGIYLGTYIKTTSNQKNVLSNKYNVGILTDISRTVYNTCFHEGDSIWFYDENQTFETVEDWKQYISENPITVVYPLATPTTQPIPAETLAILRALKSNNGVTNFISNAPTSFQYEQSLQIVIQNIWNAINNNTLSIETKG